MKKHRAIFFVLALSFFFGLSMITTGLASLPPAYVNPKTVILNPNLEQIIQDLHKENLVDEQTIETAIPKADNNKRTHKIRKGETFAGILQDYGIDSNETAAATNEMDDVYKLTNLQAGQILNIELFDKDGAKHLKTLKYKPGLTKTVKLEATDDGAFKAKMTEIKLEKALLKAKGDISGSFYGSAIDAGVTPSVVSQLITALSYDIDFQRDIQPGNKFTILFEGMTTKEGEFIQSTRPLYVKLEMKRKAVEMYITQRSDGTLGYYHADGTSARKALLKTPIDGARITSGFGMRRHPILGFTKMHKGIDFGAPTGTPIFAAGDGTVERAGYFGAYGNYLKIKHTASYATAYGHISRFPKGIKPGVRVKQGQIVAYVGSTGRSTGPHLHFEVLLKGGQVNPNSVKMPIENKLGGRELAAFNSEKTKITAALSDAPTRNELADLINEKQTSELKPVSN